MTLSRTAPDGSALPPRRLELYINALSSEDGIGDDTAFYTSELCRQVLLGGVVCILAIIIRNSAKRHVQCRPAL